MKKKSYIGWIVSRLYNGKREFVYDSLSHRRSDAIQDYLDSSHSESFDWKAERRGAVQARAHKVKSIVVAP